MKAQAGGGGEGAAEEIYASHDHGAQLLRQLILFLNCFIYLINLFRTDAICGQLDRANESYY